jgi:molybdopterin converting factor small subunit
MVQVFIPALLRDLTGGAQIVKVRGRSVRAALRALEVKHPGISARLMRGERLRPGLMIVIDGQQASNGLETVLPVNCELHLVPALAGGSPHIKIRRRSFLARRYNSQQGEKIHGPFGPR